MLTNRSMPRATVIPTLAYPEVGAAVDWLRAAFGFTPRLLIGEHRAQLQIGEDGAMVVTRARGEAGKGERAHGIMVRVDDVDAHYKQALTHGAWIVGPPEDQPYGERQYTAIDLAGHAWTFSQSIADVAPESWGGKRG
jgi:uncharacterized glyoxalase superfamily protein PhnB